jgi:hypothetical protein
MNVEPRGLAVAESYPTFWDETPPSPVPPAVAAEDAYTAFVNLIEDDLPAVAAPDPE